MAKNMFNRVEQSPRTLNIAACLNGPVWRVLHSRAEACAPPWPYHVTTLSTPHYPRANRPFPFDAIGPTPPF